MVEVTGQECDEAEMAGEVLDKFEGHLLVFERGGVKRSCTLFITENRMVVAIPEGMDPKIGSVVIVGFGIILAGLLLMNPALFVAGLGGTFAVVLYLVLVNFVVQYRSGSRIRRLRLNEILRAGKDNFEISYKDLDRVVHESVKRHEMYGPSRFFLPSLPSTTHLINVVTAKGKYTFMVESIDATRIVDLMKRFVPEKVEEKESKE